MNFLFTDFSFSTSEHPDSNLPSHLRCVQQCGSVIRSMHINWETDIWSPTWWSTTTTILTLGTRTYVKRGRARKSTPWVCQVLMIVSNFRYFYTSFLKRRLYPNAARFLRFTIDLQRNRGKYDYLIPQVRVLAKYIVIVQSSVVKPLPKPSVW